MLSPGRHAVGTTVRIACNFQDDDGTDIDPDGVVFKVRSPAGTVTTYTYGTDAALVRQNTGDYYVDLVPTDSGRWHYRWVSSGAGKATALEGTVVVQWSEIEEGASSAYSA